MVEKANLFLPMRGIVQWSSEIGREGKIAGEKELMGKGEGVQPKKKGVKNSGKNALLSEKP